MRPHESAPPEPEPAAGGEPPDLAAVFAALPGVDLLLAADAPRYTMLAATDARLAATMTTREGTIGRPLFEVFPDASPDNQAPSGVGNLRASLDEVLRTRAPHRMAVQRYDLRRPDGTWEARYWDPLNAPVFGPDGAVRYVLHRVEDVTGRERGEAARARLGAALDTERDWLRTLVLHMPAPLALHVGSEHRHALVNDAYQRLSGGRDVTGLTPREAFPELAGQGIYERFDAVYATGEPWVALETQLRFDRRGDGRVEDAWLDLRYEPLRDPSADGAPGPVTAILAFAVDVTDQVRARQAAEAALAERTAVAGRATADLAASEVRFRAVQDASPVGLVLLRPAREGGRLVDFRIAYANPAGARLVGQPGPAAMVGHTLTELFPATRGYGLFDAYVRVVETGLVWEDDVRYAADGLDAGYHIAAVRVGGGPDAGLALLYTDATVRLRADAERARLLAELGAERERLRALILQMPAPVALLEGPAHRFGLVNDAFRRISGGGRDVAGLTPREAFPEVAGQGFYERFDRVYATGEAWVGPETLVRYDRDGTGVEDIWFDLRLEPLRDGEGRVTAILNFAVDVTDQVRARREVEALLAASEAARREAEAARAEAEAAFAQAQSAYAEAAAANRAKAEFLAVMSHELRTPLNAIGGYAELIELGIHGPVTAEQRTALERIQRSQRHLLGLINGVLNYSRVEAGAVHYAVEDVPLDEVLATCEALLAPQVRAKGLALRHDAPAGEPLRVRADREKVQQVLLNLLSNAVKFTEAGGRVTLSARADAAGRVCVRVADTGRGIAADQMERVFQPFVQVDARLTRTQEGTGLGLAISRDLARGMGGELTAESAPGEGSTFTLTLPAAEPAVR